MREQSRQPAAVGGSPDASLAHRPLDAGSSAADHQSAELRASMKLPSGRPHGMDAASAQAAELAGASESSGDDSADPAMPEDAADQGGGWHRVERGDTLWKIAERHYQKGALWGGLHQVNENRLARAARRGRPCKKLRVPTLGAIILTARNRQIVQRAFELRWGVDVEAEAGAAQIPVRMFRRIHRQLARLPPSHARGTWRRLLHLDGSSGGYFDPSDDTIGVGEDVADLGGEIYGAAPFRLSRSADAGARSIILEATSQIRSGARLQIGNGRKAERVKIASVEGDRVTLARALKRRHRKGTEVVLTKNPERSVPWLEAVIRHEIGHAVDENLIDTTGFTLGLGGWQSTGDFDQWAASMGSPWWSNDGQSLDPAEQAQVREVVDRLRTAPSTAGLDDGLAPNHPIIRHWEHDVPVIEAAKPMATHGGDYWLHPDEYHGQNGRYFTINSYYREFHSFGVAVQQNQVRSYATYSPAEFFAEIYTVYYEEAGKKDARPGRLLPLAAWKQWFDKNVHEAGAAPAEAAGGAKGGEATDEAD